MAEDSGEKSEGSAEKNTEFSHKGEAKIEQECKTLGEVLFLNSDGKYAKLQVVSVFHPNEKPQTFIAGMVEDNAVGI